MTGGRNAVGRLTDLAEAVRAKNAADGRVAQLIERPALPGHFGEYVAEQVFDIELHRDAANPGFDGWFRCGELEGKKVNIKYTTKHDRLLNMSDDEKTGPDWYLVMTGPKGDAESSLRKTLPWVIESVFLFDAEALVHELKARNPEKKIGVATYVPVDLWAEAMIYPNGGSPLLEVTEVRRRQLAPFSADEIG